MASPTRAAPSVKRLMKEAKQMSSQYDPDGDIHAAPLGDGDNLFDWHFTIRGPSDSAFEEGIYHGRLLFPPQYPMKPPEIFLLTPNGRFETNKKICLSISGYHPETWLPSWSVSTALRALQAFFTTPAKGAIGGLEWPEAERRRIAKKSPEWECKFCECKMKDILNVRCGKSDENNNSVKLEEKNEKEAEAELKETDKEPLEEEYNIENSKNSKTITKTDESDKNNNSEAENTQQSQIEANLAERQRIEQTIIRQQLEYQKNDMMSLVFMIVLFILVAALLIRKLNKPVEQLYKFILLAVLMLLQPLN